MRGGEQKQKEQINRSLRSNPEKLSHPVFSKVRVKKINTECAVFTRSKHPSVDNLQNIIAAMTMAILLAQARARLSS
jgi:hypothetical protein